MKGHRSFRYRILVITGVIFVVSLSVVTMININLARESLRKRLFVQEIPSKIENILAEVDKQIMTVATSLSVIAEDPFIQKWLLDGESPGDVPLIKNRLELNVKHFDTMGSNIVSWNTGNYYNFSRGTFNITKIKDSDVWFPAFRDSGKAVGINPYTDHVALGEVAFMNVRIDNKGEFLGLISVALKLTDFVNTVVNKTVGEKGLNMMIDSDAIVRLHKDKELISSFNLSDDSDYSTHIQKITSTDSYSFHYKREDGEKIFVNTRFIPQLGWYLITEASERELFADLNRSLYSSILISFIFLLLVMSLLFVLTGFIAKNLKRLTAAVDDISEGEGDLTKSIGIKSRDEAGLLSQSINRFITTLRTMIDNVKDVSEQSREMGYVLASNAEEISSTVVEVTATMNSISDKTDILSREILSSDQSIGSIRNLISELNSKVDKEGEYISESSAAIEEMVASIHSVSKISEDKKQSIEDLTRIALSGEEDMDSTVQAIDDISRSADTMIDMIGVINSVSDQINLLSMNAAIEAAHAGDAGKGFAVVADEIRKLAETTSENTSAMSKSLNAIIGRITEAAKMSGNTGKTFKTIVSEIVEVSGSLSEVIASLKEISEGTSQITSSLSSLVDSSTGVRTSANLMNDTSLQVKESFQNVSSLATQNKDGISEINHGMKDISSALTELSTLGGQNSENLSQLNSVVERFITKK